MKIRSKVLLYMHHVLGGWSIAKRGTHQRAERRSAPLHCCWAAKTESKITNHAKSCKRKRRDPMQSPGTGSQHPQIHPGQGWMRESMQTCKQTRDDICLAGLCTTAVAILRVVPGRQIEVLLMYSSYCFTSYFDDTYCCTTAGRWCSFDAV